MPRSARLELVGHYYHVVNQANAGAVLFSRQREYAEFETILSEGARKAPIHLYAYVLLPARWHLIVRPVAKGAMSSFLHWITNTHVHRTRARRGVVGAGHLYRGRYRSFLTEDGLYVNSLCDYLEHAPKREGLVLDPQLWRWSSFWQRRQKKSVVRLSPLSAKVPSTRTTLARDVSNTSIDVERSMLTCLPLGSPDWRATLPSALARDPRPRGRPPILE